MPEERQFAEIMDQQQPNNAVGDSGQAVVISVLNAYLSAWNAVRDHFDGITACRKFVDDNIINQTKSIGGQKLYPVMRKMSEAHRHPDASADISSGHSRDSLVTTENTIRELNRKGKIEEVWENCSKDIDTDGMLIERIIPSKSGIAKSTMLDRRSILFDADAQTLTQDDETGANYAFETEVMPFKKAIPLFTPLYPAQWAKVRPGNPAEMVRQEYNTETAKKTADQNAEVDMNAPVGVVTVRCRRSPVSGLFYSSNGLIQLTAGEPFEMKIAGRTGVILYAKTGINYEYWFPAVVDAFGIDIVEADAYLPYVAYAQTSVRKGIISPSICSLTMPYFVAIIFYNALEDRNTKLLASPIFHGNFTGPNAKMLEETFKFQLKKMINNEKLTDFFTTRGQQGTESSWEKLAPDAIDLTGIANKKASLESDAMSIVGILIDDQQFKKGELLGIRQFQEQAQASNVSHFQRINIPNFDRHDKIYLTQFMRFYPEHRVDTVEIKGGIDGFSYTKTLSELKQLLGPQDIYTNLKYPSSRPTGAISAAADLDTHQILMETSERFPDNTEVSSALMKITGKIVNDTAGSELLDEKAAIEQVEGKAQQEQEAEELAAQLDAVNAGVDATEAGIESSQLPGSAKRGRQRASAPPQTPPRQNPTSQINK
ncbi:MAG: hypothetical protein JRD93_16860 [Deltaproteobacteria bacterium]|nr:hypothetical protein [Deltaproteobacteria bacterium]